ncbi:serine/threonine-protein kinase [Streptomyces sp. NPDC005970]|uniref:serine/threonine-protein kinase n=1 Tax=Streptomyces sp. NPDC005970 TaxID=3156723 RepID=UPI0033C83BA7
MTNDGGRANEPTSYELQPPQAPAAPVPSQREPNGESKAEPKTEFEAESSAASQDRQPDSPYEPTQLDGRAAAGQSDPRTSAPAPANQDPNIGRVIGGRYRLVSRLGHGGMGTVWRAHDQVVDRDVAVKEPRVPETLPEGERQKVYQRMQREARAAARIDHPSVVSVYDVAVEDGRPWLVMELVRGDSLGDRLAEGTLDPREAARIGVAVLGALTAAHDAGVLHRDVKPDNVLLGRNDRVVLTDFGIAQVEGEQGLTETGAFVGSPEFIAPERVLGQRPGPESDLWSLGVVLYAAVEGMSPFRRSHAPATLQAILSAEPQTPARGSGALGTLIMQLLRKEAAARPTAAEAQKALEEVVRPPQPVPTVLATSLYAPTQAHVQAGAGAEAGVGAGEAQSGGSRFVPPILHKNRKAQLGLGGVVLVVAAVLVLTLMKPFASESDLPKGWMVREERDVVGASLAVPSEYRRVQDDIADNASVTFTDPSGVYTVFLNRQKANDQREIKDTRDMAGQVVRYYKSPQSSMEDVESKTEQAKQQGKDGAVDLTTTYVPSGSSRDDNPIRYVKRDHIYVDKTHTAWQLTVTMPADGDARPTGDELYENVVDSLKIEGL